MVNFFVGCFIAAMAPWVGLFIGLYFLESSAAFYIILIGMTLAGIILALGFIKIMLTPRSDKRKSDRRRR